MNFHWLVRQPKQIAPAKLELLLTHPLSAFEKCHRKITAGGKHVAIMWLDLCNPFDAVCCEMRLEKLIEIDLDRSAVAWIENWLKDINKG